MAAGDRFKARPQSLHIIATLEIAVRDELGTSMLITCPRYDHVEQEESSSEQIAAWEIEAGQWTPPFIKYSVKARASATVGGMMKSFKEAKQAFPIEQDLARYIDSLSCGLGNATYTDGFVEYKPSWDSPGTMKAYLILRYRVDTADCDGRALADAEWLKGFRFLPIDDGVYEDVTQKRFCPHHDRTHRIFVRKPLATNLEHVLEDAGRRHAIGERALKIERTHFFTRYEGMLFCADIANYGAACQYAGDYMGGFPKGQGGEHELADDFLRESATVGFTRLFLEAGVSHVHIAGDGFLCGIPCTTPDRRARFDEFLVAYRRFLRLLDLTNRYLADHAKRSRRTAPKLGSRLAVHAGEYSYGKTGLAASLVPAFDGGAIIDVSRLEQGLRARVKKRENTLPGAHHVIVSTDAKKQIGSLTNTALSPLGRYVVRSKESRQHGSIFRTEAAEV